MDNFRIIPIPFTVTLAYLCMGLWFGQDGTPADCLLVAIGIVLPVALNVSFAAWLSPRQTRRLWLKWMWVPLSALPISWWVIYFVL